MCAHLRPVARVDRDPAALVGLQAGRSRAPARRSRPGGRPSRARRRPAPACRSPGATIAPRLVLLDGGHRLAEAERRRPGRAGGTAAPRPSRVAELEQPRRAARPPSPWCPARRTSRRTRCRSRRRRRRPATTGSSRRLRMSSESRIVRPSNSTLAGRAGRCRRRSRSASAVTVAPRRPSPSHADVCGSMNRPPPCDMRRGCAPAGSGPRRPRGRSRASVRQNRSCAVMSALTR